MTRYFLRFSNRDVVDLDEDEGQHFASLQDVQHEAVRGARDILCEAISRGKRYTVIEQEIVVRDGGAGETILSVSVREAAGLPRQ
jgi:hypothetical protein